MVFGSLFGGNERRDAHVDDNEKIPVSEALGQISMSIANRLPELIRTGQDLWWFLMEEFDTLSKSSDSDVQALLGMLPIKLHSIEYQGRKSEDSYVGERNQGVAYLNEQVLPSLAKRFGDEIAEMTVAHSFLQYCIANSVVINQVRLQHAVHFHNNCVSAHSFSFADQWHDVIRSLGGD